MNTLSQKIHAVLFYINEEMSKKRLAEIAGCSLAEIEEALTELDEHIRNSGVVLVQTATTVTLGTHAHCANLIEAIGKAETISPLSKAALETLAVVMYQAPVTRAEIDTVRGVNSLYSLRNLLVRGLVSRRTVEGAVIYEPTSDTLKYMGISDQSQIVDYEEVHAKIDAITLGHTEIETKHEEVEPKNEGQASTGK